MSSILPCTLSLGATQPTAALGFIPYASPQAGQMEVDANLLFNATERCVALPLLTANPAAVPGAGGIFFYVVNAAGTYTLRVKIAAGTVLTAALA